MYTLHDCSLQRQEFIGEDNVYHYLGKLKLHKYLTHRDRWTVTPIANLVNGKSTWLI